MRKVTTGSHHDRRRRRYYVALGAPKRSPWWRRLLATINRALAEVVRPRSKDPRFPSGPIPTFKRK